MVQHLIYNEILFSCKKEGNPAICNKMVDTGERSAKWNKPDKGKYCVVLLIYGILKQQRQTIS